MHLNATHTQENSRNECMKRLDQGHLHHKLEVPGLTYPGQESNPGPHGGRRASRKEPFEQLATIIVMNVVENKFAKIPEPKSAHEHDRQFSCW
jgi:hypothetical protein